MIASSAEKAGEVPAMTTSALRQLLADIDARVTVDGGGLAGTYMPVRLAPDRPPRPDEQTCSFEIPEPPGHRYRSVRLRRPNARLVSLVIRGFAARRALIEDSLPTDRAAANARRSHLSKLARASYLAPDIVEAILAGDQPPSLGARQIIRAGVLPICWAEQRRLFGFQGAPS